MIQFKYPLEKFTYHEIESLNTIINPQVVFYNFNTFKNKFNQLGKKKGDKWFSTIVKDS